MRSPQSPLAKYIESHQGYACTKHRNHLGDGGISFDKNSQQKFEIQPGY